MSRVGKTGAMTIQRVETPREKAKRKYMTEMAKKHTFRLCYSYFKNGKAIETHMPLTKLYQSGVKKYIYTTRKEALEVFKNFKNKKIDEVSKSQYSKVDVNTPYKLVIKKEFNGDKYMYVFYVNSVDSNKEKKRKAKNGKRRKK